MLQKIPPDFCKHIPWEASRKAKTVREASMAATLEGPSGRTWLVVIRRSAEGTFFTSGWPKFVQDQALRELEFLVFRYDGDTHFTAMVFDTTACEREDLLLGGGSDDTKRSGRRPTKRGRPRTTTTPTRDDATKRKRKDSVGKEIVPYRAPPGDRRQLQAACSNGTPESGKRANPEINEKKEQISPTVKAQSKAFSRSPSPCVIASLRHASITKRKKHTLRHYKTLVASSVCHVAKSLHPPWLQEQQQVAR